MKRLLSLILALLLCCGFIVSCDKEESPLESESSSDTESSSSEPSSSDIASSSGKDSSSDELSSSVDSSLSSAPSLSDGKLTYDDRGLPIFPAPVNAYTYYNVTRREKSDSAGECYDTWVFDDYEAYCGFISQYAPIGDITEDMLNDYFLVVVYRTENIYATENYSYSNFDKINNKYILVLEYTSYEIPYPEMIVPNSFDVVLIPRSECDAEPSSITVSIKRHIHCWE